MPDSFTATKDKRRPHPVQSTMIAAKEMADMDSFVVGNPTLRYVDRADEATLQSKFTMHTIQKTLAFLAREDIFAGWEIEVGPKCTKVTSKVRP
jgi:hypothetical protein